MKFSVDTAEMRGAVALVRDVVPSKAVTQEATGILIEALSEGLILTGFGTEMFIKVSCPAQVEEEGKVCVAANTLSDVVSSFKPFDESKGVGTKSLKINLDFSSRAVIIKADSVYGTKIVKHRRKLALLDAALFPSTPPVPSGGRITIPSIILKEAVSSTYYAVGGTTTGPMSGVLLKLSKGVFSSTGTDRLKLAEYKASLESSLEFSAIVPPKVASKFGRSLAEEGEVVVIAASNLLWVLFPGVIIGGFIIQGDYPDYSSLLAGPSDTDVFVDRGVFIDNINNLDFGSIEDNRVVLGFSGSKLEMYTDNARNDHIEIDSDLEMQISFDLHHLKAVTKTFNGNKLGIIAEAPNKPACFYCPDQVGVGKAITVLMPMNEL